MIYHNMRRHETTSDQYMNLSPEREDHEPCDEEDYSKDDEDVVTCLSPASIVKHFG